MPEEEEVDVEKVVVKARKRGLTSTWLGYGTLRQILKSVTFPTVGVGGECSSSSLLRLTYPPHSLTRTT